MIILIRKNSSFVKGEGSLNFVKAIRPLLMNELFLCWMQFDSIPKAQLEIVSSVNS